MDHDAVNYHTCVINFLQRLVNILAVKKRQKTVASNGNDGTVVGEVISHGHERVLYAMYVLPLVSCIY